MDMIKDIRFDEKGLVPVVAQDVDTGEVLMLAYANETALRRTMETGLAHYFSRTRQALWQKGETSGNVQRVKEILDDCDQDAILYKVYQTGAACHTGNRSCFFRQIDGKPANETPLGTLAVLQAKIIDRRNHPKPDSYTNYLFTQGIDKILKKVGEENAEVIIAAKNKNAAEVRYETADLLYHLSVLLTEMDLTWADIFAELQDRDK